MADEIQSQISNKNFIIVRKGDLEIYFDVDYYCKLFNALI